MTTTTTKKTTTPAAAPLTFDDIARKKMRARLEEYRQLLRRQTEGEPLGEEELSNVVTLLEGMGLPDYTWTRDLEAVQRFSVVQGKYKAAVDAEPANQKRAGELAEEVELLQQKLHVVREELRKAQAGSGKSASYARSLTVLAAEYPQALADIDTAVRLRLEELNRRKQARTS